MCNTTNNPTEGLVEEVTEAMTESDIAARVEEINKDHAGKLKKLIDLSIFDADIPNRELLIPEPTTIEYLSFLPFLHPEIMNMDENDWFSVFTGEGDDKKYIGKLRFTGLPKQDYTNPENVRCGCSFVYWSKEPITDVSANDNDESEETVNETNNS